MKMRWRRDVVAAGVFVLLFVYTAVSKWSNFPVFRHAMKVQPFNPRYLDALLYGLPSIELLVAILLVINSTRKLGLGASLILMIVFTGYIILIKVDYFGKVPCSCGGIIQQLSWTQHLALNCLLIAVAVFGLSAYYKKDITLWNKSQ